MIKPRVVIVVSGGVVTGVYGNQKMDVQVVDHDEIRQSLDDKDNIKDLIDKRELDIVSNDAELDNVINQEVASYFGE